MSAVVVSTNDGVAMWMRHAVKGHCGVTTAGDAGDCEVGLWGSWALSASECSDWRSGAAKCLDLCARCEGCRFISLSLSERDCSWYNSCHATRGDVSGFKSGPMVAHLGISAQQTDPAAVSAAAAATTITAAAPACTAPPLVLGTAGGISLATGNVLLPSEPLSPGYSNLVALTHVRGGRNEPPDKMAWSTTEWASRTRRNYNLIDSGLMHAVRTLFPCRITSILDFGSGGGHYSAALRRALGASRVVGVEPQDMSSVGFFTASEDSGPVQSMADFASQDHRPDPRPFDLVWSSEVLEHVPYNAHCRILNALALSARRWVVFSAGDTWQGGHGNAGPRPLMDWRMHWLS